MAEDIKKTAEVYETVSEEKVMEVAKDTEAVTEKMIDAETKIEKVIDKKEMEEVIVKAEAKDAAPQKRRGFRKEITREEIVEAWNPITALGRKVKSGEIKTLNEILDADKKILEPEIVDKLIPVKTDLIAMGQAKGKFGGGKRRAWRQTQRITREGGVLTFSAMAIAGDENGHIGVGTGRAAETLPARDKSTRKAKLNIMKLTRGCSAFDCSCDEDHSIPFEVEGKSGSVVVKLMPAPQGTGLVVANELKKVLKLAGIKDVYSQTFGSVRTTFNLVKACMEALKETNRK